MDQIALSATIMNSKAQTRLLFCGVEFEHSNMQTSCMEKRLHVNYV